MALFKVSKGLKANLPSAKTEGYCWYTTDDSLFYIDYKDENGTLQRKALNAKDTETLTGASLSTILNSSDVEIPTSKAVLDALNEKLDKVDAGSDWNQNDNTKPDYVKNRPFYTGDPVEMVLVKESTITFAEKDGTYQANVPSTFEVTVGETYKVYWDGTVYECTCENFNGELFMGNTSIVGEGSDTGEPFIMVVSNGKGIIICTKDTAASHTFSISGFVTEVVKIDEKYLPDTVATTEYVDNSVSNPLNITSATVGQIAKISAVDDTGKPTTWETVDMHTPFKPEGNSYLTFSSPNSFTLRVSDFAPHWDGTFEYFASNKTWTHWNAGNTLSAVDNDGEYVLYLRGTGNTVITGPSSSYKWVLTGTDISCIGNIENLLDYATVEAGNHPTMADYCYPFMFYGCTALTQAPSLPATTLVESCYSNMFQGCTSLTKAPALPATTLAEHCYSNMFYGCTALTQAPALPATTLADWCYAYMFRGCTSLTHAPYLPATTLSEFCYQQMFLDCASLTQAPALPATTLTTQCYYQMFRGCTSLTQAPYLPATTLAQSCYASMFYGCTSLTKEPLLPATTLADSCYQQMFYGCTSLKLSSTQTEEYTQEYRIPTTGTGTTATDALSNMFTNTGGNFMGAPEINTTYYLSTDNMIVHETEIATLREYVESMIDSPFKPAGKSYLTFSSPNSFTLAVNDATKHWDGTLEYFASNKTWTTWDGTTTLSSVENDGEHVLYLRGTGNTVITGNDSNYKWVLTGTDIRCIGNIDNLLDYATVESGNHPTMASYCYNYMFKGCTALTQAPALPATTLVSHCYQGMFSDCTALTQAPAIPATTLAEGCYRAMFSRCTSLTQAPSLPAKTLAKECYSSMFNGCTSLTQAPELPATTLASHCYFYMFASCTSLTRAPALPATTLADECYDDMFYNCSSLIQVPALPATTLSIYCYYNMFKKCSKIKLSSTQTGEYTQEYRIPTTGTGTDATCALLTMFDLTGGTFTGTPTINTTYYLSTDNMIVRETDVATLNGYVGSMIDAAIGNAIGGSY